ncbi:MAG: chromate efflux transporter [Anaerolineae bacterium]|nr:chromate efflux transporter [Anaerolineae bacterium]
MTADAIQNASPVAVETAPPRESYSRLFLRFLRFGALAWGGPVAQIAMLRQELVDEERWVSSERFNRVLAVYQVLPGPEAHELCVYFGMQARGHIGGLLAGLGFMLPGFVLMLLLSWFYMTYGIQSALFAGAFYGMQAVVGALIVRAVHRIGGHALHDRPLWGIAILGFSAQFVGVNFVVTLALAGVIYGLVKHQRMRLAAVLGTIALIGIVLWGLTALNTPNAVSVTASANASEAASIGSLFGSGLRAGLLTFGGAYTVIPYLQHDAVITGGWMSNAQFLDGLALSGILPAPLVIFGTFVGYLGGGLAGAVAVTLGIFLPAFAFTLLGHNLMERLIANTALHSFLDGVTAGVVGLIAATTLGLLRVAITDWPALVIFTIGLVILFRWKSKLNVPIVVIGAAAAGLLVSGI